MLINRSRIIIRWFRNSSGDGNMWRFECLTTLRLSCTGHTSIAAVDPPLGRMGAVRSNTHRILRAFVLSTTTTPPFITHLTLLITTLMSAIGSPSTATMSE